MRTVRNLLILLGFSLLTSCSNIDCPLNSLVRVNCSLLTAEDWTTLTLTDTLTIKAAGTDSVLLNRGIGLSSFSLPMSYTAEADTLLFCFSNARGQRAIDSLIVSHSNLPHFENIDCPAAVFHRIHSVRWTHHALGVLALTIDSVAVVKPTVDYETNDNLRIYLRSAVTN